MPNAARDNVSWSIWQSRQFESQDGNHEICLSIGMMRLRTATAWKWIRRMASDGDRRSKMNVIDTARIVSNVIDVTDYRHMPHASIEMISVLDSVFVRIHCGVRSTLVRCSLLWLLLCYVPVRQTFKRIACGSDNLVLMDSPLAMMTVTRPQKRNKNKETNVALGVTKNKCLTTFLSFSFRLTRSRHPNTRLLLWGCWISISSTTLRCINDDVSLAVAATLHHSTPTWIEEKKKIIGIISQTHANSYTRCVGSVFCIRTQHIVCVNHSPMVR